MIFALAHALSYRYGQSVLSARTQRMGGVHFVQLQKALTIMRTEDLPARETLGCERRWDAQQLENLEELAADLAPAVQGLEGLLEMLAGLPPGAKISAGGLKQLLQPSTDRVVQALACVQALLPPD